MHGTDLRRLPPSVLKKNLYAESGGVRDARHVSWLAQLGSAGWCEGGQPGSPKDCVANSCAGKKGGNKNAEIEYRLSAPNLAFTRYLKLRDRSVEFQRQSANFFKVPQLRDYLGS